MITLVLPWVIVVVCILSEAFFAASELSILSASRMALEARANQGNLRAQKVLWFKNNPDQLFGTTLLGTNISTVTGSTIASLTLLQFDPTHGEWWAMCIMSPLVLMGGEIIPKSLAQSRAVEFALLLSTPLSWINRFLTPAIFLVTRYTQMLSHLLNLDEQDSQITREELIFLVQEESQIEQEDKELISRIFAFKTLSAEDVMIPFAEVEALSKESTVRDGVLFIHHHGFSRIPIFDERVDQMIGVVHHLDLLNAEKSQIRLETLMRPILFAPKMQDIDEILESLQGNASSLVIVVDEFGSAVGLITLEDILEEIVGEIDDEFDEEEALWKLQDDGSYLIDAKTEIDKLNERFALYLPNSDDYETLAGYILSELKYIPEIGESMSLNQGPQFVIEEASERAIEVVRLTFPSRRSTQRLNLTDPSNP